MRLLLRCSGYRRCILLGLLGSRGCILLCCRRGVLLLSGILLLDSRCPQAPHAGGGRVDLALYAQAVRHSRVPVWLAGGLGVQNLAQVLQTAAPYGVDVLSGAERAPGEKDLDAIRALCALAHGER